MHEDILFLIYHKNIKLYPNKSKIVKYYTQINNITYISMEILQKFYNKYMFA